MIFFSSQNPPADKEVLEIAIGIINLDLIYSLEHTSSFLYS